MKLVAKKIRALFSVLFFVILFASCKKENAQPISITEHDIDDNASVASSVDINGFTKLILRPCDHDGQDTYVTFLNGNADWANSTGDWAQELSMCSWTNGGQLMGVRGYIRFDSLIKIPTGSTVVNAKLFLYDKVGSISAPQGNYGDNACKIEKVTSGTWDESTLTWNTQPDVTSKDAAFIPASTSTWNYNAEVDVTKLIRSLVNEPAKNYGFRISLVNESIYRSLIFASSEDRNPKLRPKLIVVYK